MEDGRSDRPTTIMDLPDDCQISIFRHLECESDRDSFGLTCRRWLEIQNRNRRTLHFDCSLTSFEVPLSRRTRHKIDPYELRRILTRYQYLESLSLSGCTELPDSGLKLLQHYGSSLHSLNLDCCFEITDTGLSFAAIGCPSLTFISLYRCNITDMGLESLAKSCSGLQSVNFSHCSSITDHGIGYLVQNCLQLSYIMISNCKGIKGTGFRGCSQTLAFLEADSCTLSPEGISSIISGGGLKFIDISNHNGPASGNGLGAIGSGFGARLQILNMRLCRTVRDESIEAIAKGCPLLVEWNLALCNEIRVAGWKSIALNCHNLRILHVNRCRNLCDRGLKALGNGCNRLLVLYMSGCPFISLHAIEFFRLSRGDVVIKGEENFNIGPVWSCRRWLLDEFM